MATPKQRYSRKFAEIVKRNGRLEDDAVKRMVSFLADLRAGIAGELATAENFELFRLSELDANLERMVAQFQTRLNGHVRGVMTTAYSNGGALAVEPLRELGFDMLYFQPSPDQLTTVLDFTANLITNIGNDTLQKVNTQIRLAALGSRSTIDAMRAVTDVLGVRAGKLRVGGGIAYNAERIIRTEVNRVANLATHGQNEKSAEVIPGLLKRWVATGDGRTRQSHLSAHIRYMENPIPVDEAFIVGGAELMHPLDPNGPAKETIHCRCREQAIVPEVGIIKSDLDSRVQKRLNTIRDEQAAKFTIADELALLNEGRYDPFEGIRPPPGRAPRGLGEEYKLRRRLISRIGTQMKWRDSARAQLENFRGQTGHRIRWKIDLAQTRVQELDKGIGAMLDFSNEPLADWAFKNEMVDGIIEYLSALR